MEHYMQKTVFLVDDNATNLTMAEEALADKYRVIALSSAVKMFKALEKFKPDLILLDVEMPEMTGFSAMELLKSNSSYSEIPVIFLTGRTDPASEAIGIKLGAVDFIMKPFSAPVLLNRIKNHLHLDELIRERTMQLARRTEQLVLLQNGIVYTFADLVENRDKNTGGHIHRTAMYIKILINAMLEQQVYADDMRNWTIEAVVSSVRLHDLGKIAIPDSILNKPGPLTDEEFQIMKTHAIAGERIIEKAIEQTGDAEFLSNAKIIAAYHHECWDGSGYPYGLKGTEIPLQARLMAIIDVYDALVSERPYKEAFPHEEAVKFIADGSGTQFDDLIIEVFTKVNAELASVEDD
jgi:putative two-component system response regulator